MLAILILLIGPVFLGKTFCGVLKLPDITLARCFCLGTLLQWCVFQIIAVPMVHYRFSFTSLVWMVTVLYIVIVVIGFLQRYRIKILFSIREENIVDRIAFILSLVIFAVALYLQIAYQYIDDDDSRFVGNIVDIIRTNKLFLINPGTGEEISLWTSDFLRDVASPWAAFQAYVAFLSGIQGTIFAHTVHPIALYFFVYAVQWEISKLFVGKRVVDRSFFCIILWIVIWFGQYSGWSAEGFIIRRIWQGKAIVAGIGIPYLIFLLSQYYQDENNKWFFPLIITNIAMCLLSNMGILFGVVLVGIFGLAYGVIKKNIKTTILLWMTAIPNVIYGLSR